MREKCVIQHVGWVKRNCAEIVVRMHKTLFHAGALPQWPVFDHPRCDSNGQGSKTTVVATNHGFRLGNMFFVNAATDEDRSSGTNETYTKCCNSNKFESTVKVCNNCSVIFYSSNFCALSICDSQQASPTFSTLIDTSVSSASPERKPTPCRG